MIVSAVPYEQLNEVYPHVYRYVEKATEVDGGRYDAANVFRLLAEREIGLWIVVDEEDDEIVAAMTTRITDYPNGRGMSIDWIGGKRMEEWLPAFSETMDAFARENGCSFIEGIGRKGWIKVLKEYGYRDIPTFRKDL